MLVFCHFHTQYPLGISKYLPKMAQCRIQKREIYVLKSVIDKIWVKNIYLFFFWSLDEQTQFQFSSVQLLSCVRLFVTPWTATLQASLSITNSWSSLTMSIESVMPSNHLILCHPLLLLPSIFPHNQGLFKWVSSSHQVAKVLEFQLQHQSFQWIFKTDLL